MNTLIILGVLLAVAVLATPAHAVINTGMLTKGLRSEFFNRFDATSAEYQNLATRVASNANREDYRWLGTVPMVREWGNGRLARGLRTESYSVLNKKYEATIIVDRDEISDDQTGQIRPRVQELAVRAATHKDFLIAQLLINGGEADFLAYDGKPFFADDHESGDSGAQDNNLTASASAPTTPTTAEFKAAFMAAVGAMLAFKDDQGLPMALNMNGLVAVVPPNMLFAAHEAMNATMIANTSNVLAGMARVVSFPWLGVSDKWYLLKTDGVVRPFVFQDREPIEFTALDRPDDEQAFNREQYLYGVRARYAMAYGYWQYAVRTDFN